MISPEKFRISPAHGDEFERNKVANGLGVGQCSDTGAAILFFGVGLSRVSPPTKDKALLLKKFQTRN